MSKLKKKPTKDTSLHDVLQLEPAIALGKAFGHLWATAVKWCKIIPKIQNSFQVRFSLIEELVLQSLGQPNIHKDTTLPKVDANGNLFHTTKNGCIKWTVQQNGVVNLELTFYGNTLHAMVIPSHERPFMFENNYSGEAEDGSGKIFVTELGRIRFHYKEGSKLSKPHLRAIDKTIKFLTGYVESERATNLLLTQYNEGRKKPLNKSHKAPTNTLVL